MSIKHLSANTARLISSSVNISSVCSVVKELVENAIDAKSSSIYVRLEKHGMTRIEVRDNGVGISKADVPLVGLANHTSKIVNYSDLDQLGSYGFRGQAVNALCAVADVNFTTRTEDDEFALTYSLDVEGRIVSSKPSHHCVGTTVVVENLFGRFPVRRKMLSTSSALRTTLRLLRCFALAKPKLAITLSHDGSIIWRKSSASTLFSAAQEVLGYKLAVKMQRIYWKGSQVPIEGVVEEEGMEISEVDEPECLEMEVEMLVPQKGANILDLCSFPSPDGFFPNVYLLINSRPIKHKKIEEVVNCWISRGTLGDLPKRKKPSWILKIELPPDKLDVNLEADKTKIILRSEDILLTRLEEILSEYYLIFSEDPKFPLLPCTEPMKERGEKACEESENKTQPESPAESRVEIANNSSNSVVPARKPCRDPSPLPHLPAKQRKLRVEEDVGMTSLDEPDTSPRPTTTLSQILNVDGLFDELNSRNEVNKDENIIEIKIPPLPVNSVEVEAEEGVADRNEDMKDKDLEDLWDSDCGASFFEEGVVDCEGEKGRTDGNAVVGDAEEVGETQIGLGEIDAQLPNLESWSRGSANFGGTVIADPVKILNPTRTTSSDSVDVGVNDSELRSEIQHAIADINANPSRSSSDKRLHSIQENDDTTMKSPLPNACSQLGRQDMRAFAEFSSKERIKILLKNPGIRSAEVAVELAKQWRSLPKEEQDVHVRNAQAAQSLRQQNAKGRQSSAHTDKYQNFRQQTLSKSFVAAPPPPAVGMEMRVSLEAVESAVLGCREKNSCGEKSKSRRNKISLVGQLRPSGMWIYHIGTQVGILRHFALQELVVYRNLMENLTIPLSPLPKPFELNESALGPELWKKLISMEKQYDVFTDSIWVTSKLIAKNGFRIKVTKGINGDACAILTDRASVLPSYGIADLKEILSKINTLDCKLSECRPIMVANYIESEAVRMCRQSPPAMAKDELTALLKEWAKDEQLICLHNLPIFVPVYPSDNAEEDV